MARIIRTLIVDDEPLARETIEGLLREDDSIEVCASCGDGKAALSAIEQEPPDLIFLDVQMPGMNGFEFLEACATRTGLIDLPFIIFTTAYERYALQAFEVHAVDYLLKPYSNERFREALERAKVQIAQRPGAAFQTRLAELLRDSSPAVVPSPDGKRFLIKTPEKTSFVEPTDIIWFEAADHYVLVHTRERSHIVRESMATLEKLLDPALFLRVHRSAIINTRHINEMRPASRDERELVLTGGETVRVSRRRLRTLRNLLGFRG